MVVIIGKLIMSHEAGAGEVTEASVFNVDPVVWKTLPGNDGSSQNGFRIISTLQPTHPGTSDALTLLVPQELPTLYGRAASVVARR